MFQYFIITYNSHISVFIQTGWFFIYKGLSAVLPLPRKTGRNNGNCSSDKVTGSRKSRMGSIEFYKLNFAFEWENRGGHSPL